jgi:hypothetical protein
VTTIGPPITGDEDLGGLALMADNWEQSAEAAMDNPLGGISRGWARAQPFAIVRSTAV